MTKDYTIGLDIGTNSVGWAVLTDDYQLMKRKMSVHGNTEKKKIKKNFWGARLFDEGQTAEFRRTKRTNRRRLARRKYRLSKLQDLFAEELCKQDDCFFVRLEESFLVPEEKQYKPASIFPTLEEEKEYYQKYPTIYHLRQKLVDSTEKEDLRLVYLALAHLLKYRGHFLFEGDLDTENTSIEESFSVFLEQYSKQSDQPLIVHQPVLTILTDKLSKTKKVEEILKYYPTEKINSFFAQCLKLIVGNQANFKRIFDLEAEVKLQFSKETYEEDLESLLEKIGDEYLDIFLQAKKVHDAILLSEIISSTVKHTKAKLSSGMVERYERHKADLAKFKQFVKENVPQKATVFFKDTTKNGYAGYIKGKTTQEEFYKFVKKELSGVVGSEPFLEKIDQETFLLKQRTYTNGVIPHQVHLIELKAIIDQQKQHYPFLEEAGPKIIALFKFRIPYYVGPLAKEQEASSFAWIERKTAEKINPWNFSEVVDIEKSAMRFIQRMTKQDTYLPTEKVLPKNSLLYQKYMIFNELTKVSYKDERGVKQYFSGDEKQQIFKQLFQKERGKITVKKLQNFLYTHYHIENAQIFGIEKAFNASYSTYHDFMKLAKTNQKAMQEWLEQPEMEPIFEDIVKILTIFEDRQMIKHQLSKYQEVFGEKLLKEFARKHYTGWGRFSAKLIHGIRDRKTNKTILDYLINDDDVPANRNRNLMQLINDEHLSFKEEIAKATVFSKHKSLVDVIQDLPGSPAIKKGIWQSLKIVEELIAIIGYKPKNIVIEMARENQKTHRTSPRLKALENGLKQIGSTLLKEQPTDNKALQKERLYLYYLQNGRDMYTGEPLEIENLHQYEVDHIIPRSFIVDNSIDNKVLVASKQNQKKRDDVPKKQIVNEQRIFWNQLKEAKLISPKKYAYLTKIELTPEDKARFIQRQLVETRQITKHVANILHQSFNQEEEGTDCDGVQIITLKATLTSQFRQTFGLYKVREINPHHHAHDAYLNGFIANVLLKRYPKLAPEFVYGKYVKYSLARENKATAKKEFYSNILKFLESDEPFCDENGEIYWEKSHHLPRIKKVLSSHQVNVVKKVEQQKGGFYKETVNSKEKPDKLIERKNNWDVTKYGGFGSPVIAYAIAFVYAKGKTQKKTRAIEGITIMEQAAFEKDPTTFLKEKGFPQVTEFIKLPKYTLFEFDNGRRRFLASHKESQKGNPFILSDQLVTLLYHAQHYDKITYQESFDYVNTHLSDFSAILTEVLAFAEKYTLADKNIERIQELYEENKYGETSMIAQSFLQLLQFNAIGAPADFKFFGVTIPRKRYTSLTEIWDATIIYQSVTGLYETRIRMGDLWAGEQ